MISRLPKLRVGRGIRLRKRHAIVMMFATTVTLAHAGAPERAFFPIMIWDRMPGDAATIQQVKECGITVAGFVAPQDLAAIEAAGLKAIISDRRSRDYNWLDVDEAVARRNVESLVNEVGNSPAVFGYYLRDEPPTPFFSGLAKVSSLFKEKSPGTWPYINLFPNLLTPDELQAKDYQAYLEQFIATCAPPILSYDHYALMDDGSLRDGYWQNLETIRAVSLKHHIPFWNIVLCCAHFDFREPTLADLRFQAYSTLAYGGRGIAYFLFFAPQIGNYRAAPIDQFGHETPTYSALRNVNLQILQLAPTVLQLTSTKVYHFSPTRGCQSPPDDSILTAAGSPDFLAGEFLHADGTPYVLIVNKNFIHSSHVALTFRSPGKKQVDIISPYSGQPTDFKGEQCWLAPGQGALLRIKN